MDDDEPSSRQGQYKQKTGIKRAIQLLIVVSILTVAVSGLAGIAAAEPALDGDGTEANPYEITDVTELQEMEKDLSAHYVLVNNIDASNTENHPSLVSHRTAVQQ